MKTRAALAALAMGATMSLAGCSLAADVTTARVYDPSDGIGESLGTVSTDNFLMVTSGVGEPAVLIGHIYNAGNDNATVTLTLDGDAIKVVVPSRSGVELGLAEGDKAIVVDAPVAPGRVTELTLEAGGASVTKSVPVTDGTLPEYAAVLEQLATR